MVKKQVGLFSLFPAVIIALFVSLIAPLTVIADDEVPPTPEISETTVPPVDELVVETEIESEQQNQDTIITPEGDLILSELQEEIAEDTSITPDGDLTLSELQEEIPEDTSVVVLLDNEVEPLVTQAAAEAVVVGDPIWCPDNQSPIPGSNGCTASFATLSALLTFLEGDDPNEAGVIWILSGNDASAATVEFDGSNFLNMPNFALTLQGGWDGSPLGTISGTSSFSVPLSIINWNAPITVNQISITGSTSTGLNIDTTGEVVLEDVTSNLNSGYGAQIFTQAGVIVQGSSQFNDNTLTGLYIETNDTVNLSGVSVDGNDVEGIYIDAGSDVTLGDLNASNNTDSGLIINSLGGVTSNNITASDNGGSGAEFYSTDNVSINGTNIFDGNTQNGLYIEAIAGGVDVNDLTATNNDENGVIIYSNGTINITGSNIFDENVVTGFSAESASGNIVAENLYASGNDGLGISLVTLTGNIDVFVAELDGNGDSGLYIDAGGDVNLEDIVSTGNSANGVDIIASGSLAILGSNQFNDNGGSGLSAFIAGDIDAENLIATNNDAGGVELTSLGDTSIAGVNVFEGNAFSGLFVDTLVDLSLANITANTNGLNGAELNAGGTVDILGGNIFNGNNLSGLYISSGDVVSVANISAAGNGTTSSFASGAEIYTNSDLILTGTNNFSGNRDYGLLADVGGNVFASNITAIGNGIGGFGTGAEFSVLGTFSLNGSNIFNNNSTEGLLVISSGNISIENVEANNNAGSGLVFDTDGNVEVTCGLVTGNSVLQIDTDMTGMLTLNGVNVDGNPDITVGIDSNQLVLNSNSCFTYPDYYADDESGGGGGGNGGGGSVEGEAELGVRYVTVSGGQVVDLDCKLYAATYLVLQTGDGAIIPCPIVDSVALDGVDDITFFKSLPENSDFIAGMNLVITKNGEMFRELDQSDVVWFLNPTSTETGGYEATYWNGTTWIDITDQIPPFLTIFFLVPENIRNEEFAILYWDGLNWIELSNGNHLGNGRIVSGLGWGADGAYYQANVNFIGTFVLIKK